MRYHSAHKGFTLIEVAIYAALLSIILSIYLPYVRGTAWRSLRALDDAYAIHA